MRCDKDAGYVMFTAIQQIISPSHSHLFQAYPLTFRYDQKLHLVRNQCGLSAFSRNLPSRSPTAAKYFAMLPMIVFILSCYCHAVATAATSTTGQCRPNNIQLLPLLSLLLLLLTTNITNPLLLGLLLLPLQRAGL